MFSDHRAREFSEGRRRSSSEIEDDREARPQTKKIKTNDGTTKDGTTKRAGAQIDAHVNEVTPLYVAAQNGHVKVVEALLRARADHDKVSTSHGTTPLYVAAARGHVEVVRALLDAGADVNKASFSAVTPLYVAAQNGHVEVVKALLDK